MEIKKRTKCSICRADLIKILDLGQLPLANHLLRKEELRNKEKKYKLTLMLCHFCGLVQLGQIVSPEIMYKDYLYIPSMSRTLVAHFEELCEQICQTKKKIKFVVDVGSNDGTLFGFFKNKGCSVLGIDPAENIARAATQSGILTIPRIFNLKESAQIVKKFGKSDVITATNVFAHIEDLFDLYEGVNVLLKDDGICVIEVSYLLDMMEKTLFDSIYHEHLYYFSVSSLQNLFSKTPLTMFNVEHIDMHGGSLRIWLKKRKNKKIMIKTQIINSFIKKEEKFGLNNIGVYKKFNTKINKIKKDLTSLLLSLKKKNKIVAGFGAPAKGNILLNYFNIGSKTLDFIVDSTTYKQFRYTPGNHLQILPETTIYIEKPDYILVLAWNFADEIIKKHSMFKGKFIIPLPKPKII